MKCKYKNHVVTFCFGMDRALHQHERVLLQHTTRRLEREGKFSWNRQISVGLSVWVPPSAYGLGRYSRPRAQFLPIRASQPVNNIYLSMYSSFIHKHSCVLSVKRNKNLFLLDFYFRSYLIFQKNIYISDLLTILVCEICISQEKFNSFKEARGRWHIPAY